MNTDIRWHQRLTNFTKALAELSETIALTKQRPLTKLEQKGVIQAFEYNYELAWNCIKDFYQFQGETDIQGSRVVARSVTRRSACQNSQPALNLTI